MTTVWNAIRGELAAATRDDFERLVLSLGQVVWPGLVRVERLKDFDKAGVDLAKFGANGALLVAVQCKGLYSTRELDASHCKQILASIETFIRSPLSCDDYVVVHNRTGKDRVLVAEIEAALARVVASGKAKRTMLRDRQTFTTDVQEALENLIIERLREETAELLARMARLFRFGSVYLPDVPFSQFRLDLHRFKPPEISQTEPSRRSRIADAVVSPAKLRWTLLTGLFGSGKSSAALHAVMDQARAIIFVPCADLPFQGGFGGTNTLLTQVSGALHLFDDFADDDRERLERLAGPLLRIILSREKSDTILILDGLDENRTFSTSAGVTRLANALVELRCPIVLTTRQEHFDATFGNFEQLLDDYPAKGAAQRTARLFKLEPWSSAEIAEFLLRSASQTEADSRSRLEHLATSVSAQHPTPWPEELLSHPLFLQMIAELVAEGKLGALSKAAIIGEWVERKIMRDLSVTRHLPVEVFDRGAFVDQMMTLMEMTAARMLESVDTRYRLVETIDSDVVVQIATGLLGGASLDIASVVNVSLLVPVTQRRRANIPVRYSHRVFQEYFTARHSRSAGLKPELLPVSVARLMGELP